MVVVLDRLRVEDREVVGFLVVFEAAHKRALGFSVVAQPGWGKMRPVVDDVIEAGGFDGAHDGVVLRPVPFTGRAFDRAPRDVIFVGDEPVRLHPLHRVDGGGGPEDVWGRGRAGGRRG